MLILAQAYKKAYITNIQYFAVITPVLLTKEWIMKTMEMNRMTLSQLTSNRLAILKYELSLRRRITKII